MTRDFLRWCQIKHPTVADTSFAACVVVWVFGRVRLHCLQCYHPFLCCLLPVFLLLFTSLGGFNLMLSGVILSQHIKESGKESVLVCVHYSNGPTCVSGFGFTSCQHPCLTCLCVVWGGKRGRVSCVIHGSI